MFEGKEGKNCEECFEITGRFSPTVGPIIRRLQSDTTGHKWLINRRVGRRDLWWFMIYCCSTLLWSGRTELLSPVRAGCHHQAGISASSPGQAQPRCERSELPGSALTSITISSLQQARNWPSIKRWSAPRWDNVRRKQQQYWHYPSHCRYISLWRGRLSDSNDSILC